MAQVGEILSELRKDRGLKQSDVSKLTNISVSSISAYETGSRYPGVDVLTSLSEVYEVTTDYLLGLSSSDISPAILNEEFVDGVTFGAVLNSLSSLEKEDRRAIMRVVKAVEFETDVVGRTKGTGR